MITIFSIIIAIFIVGYLIHKIILDYLHIEQSPDEYVNHWHKYVESTLRLLTLIIVTISITDYYNLRILIFVIPTIMFLFRGMMQFKYEKEYQDYLFSFTSFGLFVIGTIVYGVLNNFPIVS